MLCQNLSNDCSNLKSEKGRLVWYDSLKIQMWRNFYEESKTLSVIIAFALVLSLFHVMPASAKVKISATKKTLYVGKSTTLKVTGTKKKGKWNLSNKKVATVTQKGKVTVKKKGMATIKAIVAKSTFKCNVTIKDVNNTGPTPTQIPVKEDEIVNVNKLLCEDENISVVFKEIKNGKIILAVSNSNFSHQ